jgi:hypothetical protein
MVELNCYISSDYAGISAPHVKFYYGYEVEDENGEWCFTAKFQENGQEKIITIPYSKLRVEVDMFQCVSCLLQGIAWIFAKYGLSLQEA